jgi:phosphoribosylformylglycinamidine synthase
VETPKAQTVSVDDTYSPKDLEAALKILVSCPDQSSKRWIWEQYDHMVMADTIEKPGGDAAVVRIHGTTKAIAATSDCNPRYCFADPYEGGKQAVAESWRNITATGAKPLAVTDNMNFGNPERPEIMGQFVGCIKGISEACVALDYPVVSGNVSLYNETNGVGILPTPTIGGVGLITNINNRASIAFKEEGHDIIIIGETIGHMGQSLYLREIEGREEGTAPPVDLVAEQLNGNFVRNLIESGQITTCHDISGGGLIITLAEMAMASNIGFTIHVPQDAPTTLGWLFGEDQARYVIATSESDAIIEEAKIQNIKAEKIGQTNGKELTVGTQMTISVSELIDRHQNWLPGLMSQT